MSPEEKKSLLAIPPVLAVAVGVAWAGSQGGAEVAGVPVFAVCAGLSFAINWLVFIHAFSRQTERYYDLTGSLTYASVIVAALALAGRADPRALLLGAVAGIWAARLGRFLFARIRRDGKDARFDEIKTSFARFFAAWTLQGLWVLLTVSCALAAITAEQTRPLGLFALLGSGVWGAGFAVEVIADREKQRFRAQPENRGRFIQSGIWAWSQHPNYFGEITLWVGVALIALPALTGWQHVTLLSPIFVYLLITRVSGIPPLQARADQAWGDDPAYRAYRERTPKLVPRAPRST